MAGAVESGAQVAVNFMDSLKREPLSLALVVMNVALLAFFYTIMITVAAQREREVNLLYEDHKQVRELLAKCVVPDRAWKRDDDDEVQHVVHWPPLPTPRPSTAPREPLPDERQ